jgi:hypothetical protein
LRQGSRLALAVERHDHHAELSVNLLSSCTALFLRLVSTLGHRLLKIRQVAVHRLVQLKLQFVRGQRHPILGIDKFVKGLFPRRDTESLTRLSVLVKILIDGSSTRCLIAELLINFDPDQVFLDCLNVVQINALDQRWLLGGCIFSVTRLISLVLAKDAS